MNCALPGFNTGTWTGKSLVRRYMGANPRYDREGKDSDWNNPKERPEETGCPGSWYRTDFVQSVLDYRRKPDSNGGRIPNRLLDLCENTLVIEAVNYLEACENEWRCEEYEKSAAKRESK